jgi:hypothetical protein
MLKQRDLVNRTLDDWNRSMKTFASGRIVYLVRALVTQLRSASADGWRELAHVRF